jgi:integrase
MTSGPSNLSAQSGNRQAALSAAQIDAAREYMKQARSLNTRVAYERGWRSFARWCASNGRNPLPADPATVAVWLAAMADGGDGAKAWSRSSINQALAAVMLAHRSAGYGLDRKHPLIAETWSGISRVKAKQEVERQARPILTQHLRDLLAELRPERLAADARDAALLAVGWAAALRRSELVGLDWQELGNGVGVLRIDERGLSITLVNSKGAQSQSVTVVVPLTDMPAAHTSVARWVAVAQLAAGQPVFRAIDKRQRLKDQRLTARSVSRIIKSRLHAMMVLQGDSRAQADELVKRFSGHSLRAGYTTAAATANVPTYRIQQHTRHKSADMVARYVREADKWTRSGLRGVGF